MATVVGLAVAGEAASVLTDARSDRSMEDCLVLLVEEEVRGRGELPRECEWW